MPAPIPRPLRRLIQRRASPGQTAADIARALHLCPRTVRQRLRRFGDQPARLRPAYRPGPGRPPEAHPPYAPALALRRQHPPGGAGYIRVRRADSAGPAGRPSARALRRWFRRQQQPPAAPGRRPPAEADRAAAPHDTWQMDAAEPLRLAGGQGVCWPRLVDEYSGAFLATTLPPPTTGRTCRRRPCRRRCAPPSRAGGCRAARAWTTASRGARGATGRRRWPCG
jgi:hypothetical protein